MKEKQEVHHKFRQQWEEIQKKYPEFARVHIAQQTIMMEAVYLGDRFISLRMCQLLERMGGAMLFSKFWLKHCKQSVIPADLQSENNVLNCVTETSRDPARCFDLPRDDWFDDPFADGQTMPPIPPDPHI